MAKEVKNSEMVQQYTDKQIKLQATDLLIEVLTFSTIYNTLAKEVDNSNGSTVYRQAK